MTRWTPVTERRALLAGSLALACLLHPCLGALLAATPPPSPRTPTIVFGIVDDGGIDQRHVFGYGGATPPREGSV